MKSLLLLEDDMTYRTVLSGILEKTYIVYQANTIAGAIQVLSMKNIDYICSDYHLPDGIGIQILEYLRNSNKVIPTIIMIANMTNKMECEARQFGAVDVIEKTAWDFLDLIKANFPIFQ